MFKYLLFPLLTLFYSCLSPNEINVSIDNDAIQLDNFLETAFDLSLDTEISKQVKLDDSIESMKIPFDSLVIRKDLNGLLDYTFKRLIRDTNYNKSIKGNVVNYSRKAKEKNGPVLLIIQKDGQGQIMSLKARFENENYLYRSTQKFNLSFEGQKLTNYKVEGERKLIGLDPSNYIIEASLK